MFRNDINKPTGLFVYLLLRRTNNSHSFDLHTDSWTRVHIKIKITSPLLNLDQAAQPVLWHPAPRKEQELAQPCYSLVEVCAPESLQMKVLLGARRAGQTHSHYHLHMTPAECTQPHAGCSEPTLSHQASWGPYLDANPNSHLSHISSTQKKFSEHSQLSPDIANRANRNLLLKCFLKIISSRELP